MGTTSARSLSVVRICNLEFLRSARGLALLAPAAERVFRVCVRRGGPPVNISSSRPR